MTPKEKAEELVNKYWDEIPDIFFEEAKQCALIAVDEILKEVNHSDVGYWKQVKQEIENL